MQLLNDIGEKRFQELVIAGGKKFKEVSIYKKVKRDILNISYDTEDDSKGNCHLIIFYIEGKSYVFYNHITALYFLAYSTFEYQKVIVWALNAEYDLNNLIWQFDYLVERFYNKSRFIFAKFYFKNLLFYDIHNFYQCSVAELGKLVGLPKLDYDLSKREVGKVNKEEVKYCLNDAVIVAKGVDSLESKFKEYDIASCATLPSCALQLYLKNYSPIDFTQLNRNNYIVDNSFIYQAYFGGRTEVFKVGYYKKKLTYVDVNSLYPFVMKNYEYPNPYSDVIITKKFRPELSGIVNCKVKAPSIDIPVLPYRNELGKLLFPIGEFVGTWTVVELTKAIQLGYKIQKVYEAVYYTKDIMLFNSFVDDLYNLRVKATNELDKTFYKLLMNSLYGKFAEKRSLDKYIPIEDGEVTDRIVYDRCLVQEEYYPKHNNVIISAYVTSYARLILLDYLLSIVNADGIIYYCDTDSIIYEGNVNLPIGKDLGQLKIEYDIVEAEFIAPKFYRFKSSKGDWYYRCKGVPAYLQDKMFITKKVYYRRPIRYQEGQVRKLQPNLWVDYSKNVLTKYDKRITLSNGNTQPIELR